jgi:hypothetical protein
VGLAAWGERGRRDKVKAGGPHLSKLGVETILGNIVEIRVVGRTRQDFMISQNEDHRACGIS